MALGGLPHRQIFGLDAASRARAYAAYRRAAHQINRVRMSEISAAAATGGLAATKRIGQGTFQTWPMPSRSKRPALARAFYKPSEFLTQAQAAALRMLLARRILWRG